MSPLAQALATSPELFPAAFDPASGTVTLLRLSRHEYELAAFLDGRIAGTKPRRHLSFPELDRAVADAGLEERCNIIFHLGHVGSTLLSRLLGRHAALFSLREPEILRTLTTACEKQSRDLYLPAFLKLWSRTFEHGARTVLKTTSFVAEIAGELLSRSYTPKAIMMGVPPEIYLATILGGENAPAEARRLAPFRLSRLNRRLHSSWNIEQLSEGELVAMGWACEALSLAEAAQPHRSRVLVLDFEKFLAQPQDKLRNAFDHFGVDVTQSEVGAILTGGDLQSYSKATEYQYDSEMRRAMLADSRSRRGEEIRSGLIWLERAATTHPQIGNAIGFFG
jgi:hypothetical protein